MATLYDQSLGTNPVSIGGATVPGSDPLAQGIGSIYDLIRGVSGYDVTRAQNAAALADPFATQRPQYQQMLQGLLTDPNSFKKDPGYQFALSEGQQGIERQANALYGGGGAGALLPELAKYTEGYAAQNYDQRINQLMTLSGATTGSPGTAGQLLAGGYQNQDKSLAGGALGLSAALPWILQQLGIDPSKLGLGGAGSGLGGGFTPDLNSQYWSQFTPSNYDPTLVGNAELGVTAGNTGPGNTGFDEFGNVLPGDLGAFDPSAGAVAPDIGNIGDFFSGLFGP
jgi:hypothetical protein